MEPRWAHMSENEAKMEPNNIKNDPKMDAYKRM